MRHRPPTHRPRRRAAALAGLTATAVVAGLVALTGTASAATTTRVSNDDITAACTTSATLCHDGVATVVDGAGADLGSGFLRLSTPGATDKADVFSRALYGKPLSALTALGYETYIETPGSGDPRQAPSYTIEATGPQGITSLVWEPVYSGTAVAVGTWQTWNPGAMPGWWASRDVTATGTPNRFGFATYTATFADVGKDGTSGALRKAQLAMIAAGRAARGMPGRDREALAMHPFFWGGFAYVGAEVAPVAMAAASSGS